MIYQNFLNKKSNKQYLKTKKQIQIMEDKKYKPEHPLTEVFMTLDIDAQMRIFEHVKKDVEKDYEECKNREGTMSPLVPIIVALLITGVIILSFVLVAKCSR